MTSLVARRIAELEATSGSSGIYSTTSTARPSRATTPAVYGRERLHVEPPNIASDDTQPYSTDARDDVSYASSTSSDDDDRVDEHTALPSPSSIVEPKILDAPGIHHYQHHHHQDEYVEEVKFDHAGGYYSRPKRLVVDNRDGLDGCSVAAAVAAADSKQQQQLHENRKMIRKIAQLEDALALAQSRVAHLVSSSAKAAETASRRRRDSEAAIAGEQACVGRICELEDSLGQAEKRASWLQSELQVVWACSIQRVGELESELEYTRRQQSKGGEGSMSAESGSYTENESEHGYADASGGGSLSGEIVEPGSHDCGKEIESGDGQEQMMNETEEALYGLRAKFYRAMGERNKFKARCNDLQGKLLGGSASTNSPSIISNSTDGRDGVGEDGDNGDGDDNHDDDDGDDDDDYGPSGNNSDTEITDTIESNDTDANIKTSVLLADQETTRDTNKMIITSSTSMDSTTIPTANESNNDGREEKAKGCASHERGTSSGSRGSASTRSTRSISSRSSNSSRATVAVTAAPSRTTSGKFSPWRWSPPARTGPRRSIAVDE